MNNLLSVQLFLSLSVCWTLMYTRHLLNFSNKDGEYEKTIFENTYIQEIFEMPSQKLLQNT